MKLDRKSLKGTEYKAIEAERSNAIGQIILKRYESGKGLKYVRERNNNKILQHMGDMPQANFADKRLLEVGCGFGDFLAYIQFDVSNAFGLDLSQKQVKAARERLPGNSRVLVADAEELPFADGSFDLIIMRGIIHHLGNPDQAIKEARWLLSDGGKLIILEGDPASPYRRFFLFLADILGIEHEVSFFPLLSSGQIARILVKNGFLVEQKRVSGLFTGFGLAGFGGERLWQRLNAIENLLETRLPLFTWFNLIIGSLKYPAHIQRLQNEDPSCNAS